jgi:hypothetical protein
VALSVAYQTVASFTASSTSLYTVPSSTTVAYGSYARDLVITNSGTAGVYVSLGTGATSAATASSFAIPAGGSVLLTQCQVPASTIIYGIASAASTVSIGFATLTLVS